MVISSRSSCLRVAMVLAVVFMMSLTVGCAPRDIAYGVSVDDLSGAWEAGHENTEISLNLAEDGTFTAQGWPSELICSERGAQRLEDLDWENTFNFEGRWETVSSDLTHSLVFSVLDFPCDDSGWNSYVWSQSEDELFLKVFLGSVMDPDSASADQVLWLRKKA